MKVYGLPRNPLATVGRPRVAHSAGIDVFGREEVMARQQDPPRSHKKALETADLRELRFHDLRHTFGTHAIRAADPREVMEWMGHADIQTTQKYLAYKPRRDAAKRLAAAFEDTPAEATAEA